MEKIGVVGQGFVGTAVREGMKNFFDVRTFDTNGSCNENSLFDLIQSVNEIFLCLPTPMRSTGECNLSIVRNCLSEISEVVQKIKKKNFIVIIKSTIPPGTTERLNEEFGNIHIAFNPEFLTEANSIEDYKNQNRIIIGSGGFYAERIKDIFLQAFPKTPIIITSPTIAETIKYVTNCFLALKVSYANEIYQFCEQIDIDYNEVIRHSLYDDRLGKSHWSVPGPDGDFGFGGHCLPKDTNALRFEMNALSVDSTMLNAIIKKNEKTRTDKDWERQVGRAVLDD